jgi:YggT family protein
VGRPWWYDNYWQRQDKPGRRLRLPRRQTWVWLVLVIVCVLLSLNQTGFRIAADYAAFLFLFFVNYLCHILSFAIIIRAILSWFSISRYNLFIAILDDMTEPILAPLRRVVPLLGMIDITPIVAIIILNLIPPLIGLLLGAIGL